jgi:hypothetical protein
MDGQKYKVRHATGCFVESPGYIITTSPLCMGEQVGRYVHPLV